MGTTAQARPTSRAVKLSLERYTDNIRTIHAEVFNFPNIIIGRKVFLSTYKQGTDHPGQLELLRQLTGKNDKVI